jgi:hypothetical protein
LCFSKKQSVSIEHKASEASCHLVVENPQSPANN